MAIPFVYNLRSVTNRPVSTATTAIGIGLTVSIFIGALALAAGFRASLVTTGSPDNALVLRKGANSEISSGVTLDQVNILKSNPAVAVGPDGRPRASAEMVIVVNKERLGQKGSSNVMLRGVDAAAADLRGSSSATSRWSASSRPRARRSSPRSGATPPCSCPRSTATAISRRSCSG